LTGKAPYKHFGNSLQSTLESDTWTLLDEMIEIESGKATADRPQLARAMALCRLTGAVLCVAKLDRLSRDAHFLIGLDEADVDFVAWTCLTQTS